VVVSKYCSVQRSSSVRSVSIAVTEYCFSRRNNDGQGRVSYVGMWENEKSLLRMTTPNPHYCRGATVDRGRYNLLTQSTTDFVSCTLRTMRPLPMGQNQLIVLPLDGAVTTMGLMHVRPWKKVNRPRILDVRIEGLLQQ